jgi:hypothetical protein
VGTDLSELVQECHRRAAECGRQAREQSDLKLREDFIVLERRWRMLARYYELDGSRQRPVVDAHQDHQKSLP